MNLINRVQGNRKGGPKFSKGLHAKLGSTLEYSVWLALMKRMIELINEEILGNGLGFDLPMNLGTIRVIKLKPNRQKPFVDLKHLSQTGETKTQSNWHSFGYVYKLVWLAPVSIHIPCRTIYEFIGCRSLKRALAQKIFAGQDYLPAPNNGSLLIHRS